MAPGHPLRSPRPSSILPRAGVKRMPRDWLWPRTVSGRPAGWECWEGISSCFPPAPQPCCPSGPLSSVHTFLAACCAEDEPERKGCSVEGEEAASGPPGAPLQAFKLLNGVQVLPSPCPLNGPHSRPSPGCSAPRFTPHRAPAEKLLPSSCYSFVLQRRGSDSSRVTRPGHGRAGCWLAGFTARPWFVGWPVGDRGHTVAKMRWSRPAGAP